LIRVNKIDVPILKKFNPVVFPIANGFDPQKFKFIDSNLARNHLGIKRNKKIIFTLGNLIKRKGFQFLIDAIEKCIRVRTDILCFIGGSGPLKNEIQKQINELKLQDSIKLLGFVSNDMLAYWMSAADLFVLSSLSEGNPTVMFEALGCGKPFIGTNVGGIPEIIINDKLGILVEPMDPVGLSQALLQGLKIEWNDKYIREYAMQFTWDNIAEQIVDVYESVMESAKNVN
jgi:teichuronic acid biosynthesis glycosyltransferase TuaC